MKKYICVLMALVMSNIPNLAIAGVLGQMGDTGDREGMISTATVVEQLTRADDERKVQEIVGSAEVRGKLATFGITPQDVSGRLASLSDTELRQMATQMEQARYGGDGELVGILVVVLLVVLIIYLVKRV